MELLTGSLCLKVRKGVIDMKKIAMVMAVLAAAALIAGSAYAWGDGWCFGGRDGKDGKFDKDHSRAGQMKEEMKKELGLTAEQEKQLEAGREAHRAEAKALYGAIKAKKDELKAAMAKPGVTRAQVEPIVTELKALEAQMTDKRIDGIFSVKAILTPEQFAKLEAMKEKHMKEWKGKHGRDKGPKAE